MKNKNVLPTFYRLIPTSPLTRGRGLLSGEDQTELGATGNGQALHGKHGTKEDPGPLLWRLVLNRYILAADLASENC